MGWLWMLAVFGAVDVKATPNPPPVLSVFKKIGVDWPVDKFAWMNFVSFSPDGKFIASDASATGDVSGDLTLWSFPEGRLVKRLPGNPMAISPDWKFYATDHDVRDMANGAPVISSGENLHATYAFTPDGQRVAEVIAEGKKRDPAIRVMDLKTKALVRSFGKHRAFAIAISPDGKILASGHWNLVIFWDLNTGRRLAVLHGTGGYVSGLTFSRDGALLAVGTDRGRLQVWDVRPRKRLNSIQLPGGYVEPAFSPDGRSVASGIYGSGAVWLVDARTARVLDHRRISDLGCGSVTFSPDGQYLATPSTGGLIRWPYDVGGTIRVFRVRSP